jgi:CHASE2 domain-containing sensor protein
MTRKSVITLLIALLMMGITVFLHFKGMFDRPEFFVYDVQAKRLRAEKAAESKIKVILVDEASFASMSNIVDRVKTVYYASTFGLINLRAQR